jgi:hypothetical protein
MHATAFNLSTRPAGSAGEWVAAPQRQLIFVRRGRIEVATSAGERRRFGPGDLLFLGDVGGRSIPVRNAGRTECELLVAQLG